FTYHTSWCVPAASVYVKWRSSVAGSSTGLAWYFAISPCTNVHSSGVPGCVVVPPAGQSIPYSVIEIVNLPGFGIVATYARIESNHGKGSSPPGALVAQALPQAITTTWSAVAEMPL